MEIEGKGKRRLPYQLIDSVTSAGINMRKLCVFVRMQVHVTMCQS